MKSYVPPSDDEGESATPLKKPKAKRAKKDKDAPKNAASAYIIFTTSMRTKVSTV